MPLSHRVLQVWPVEATLDEQRVLQLQQLDDALLHHWGAAGLQDNTTHQQSCFLHPCLFILFGKQYVLLCSFSSLRMPSSITRVQLACKTTHSSGLVCLYLVYQLMSSSIFAACASLHHLHAAGCHSVVNLPRCTMYLAGVPLNAS